MENRRTFIKQVGLGTAILTFGKFPLNAFTDDLDIVRLTILHTNDVHSRIDPFPLDGSKNEGLGGVSKRSVLIDQIRAKEKNVLLFDAGDIFQGTPYFNFYGGELEIKLMSMMKYDAATMGNHDFDDGIDGFVKQLKHTNFPILLSNYDMKDTEMNGRYLDYKIFEKDGIKVGVFGLGIELHGLVPKALYGETKYLDPLIEAKRISTHLKLDLKCDYIVCLSHLGYKYDESKISDIVLAENTDHIDCIIGGHTHTFLKEATMVNNKSGKAVAVNQAGWAGINLGRIDVFFERNKKGTCLTCKNLPVQ